MTDCNCIKATHEMEERYSRLILEYSDENTKQNILDEIDSISKELKYTPTEVTITNSTPNPDMLGEICIEFDDDYDKLSENFHEKILKSLHSTCC